MTAWQSLLGALPLFALSAVWEGAQRVQWTLSFVVLLLLLGPGGTALTTTVWYWLIQRDDAGRLSLYLFLVPNMRDHPCGSHACERLTLLSAAGITLTVLVVLYALRHDARVAN